MKKTVLLFLLAVCCACPVWAARAAAPSEQDNAITQFLSRLFNRTKEYEWNELLARSVKEHNQAVPAGERQLQKIKTIESAALDFYIYGKTYCNDAFKTDSKESDDCFKRLIFLERKHQNWQALLDNNPLLKDFTLIVSPGYVEASPAGFTSYFARIIPADVPGGKRILSDTMEGIITQALKTTADTPAEKLLMPFDGQLVGGQLELLFKPAPYAQGIARFLGLEFDRSNYLQITFDADNQTVTVQTVSQTK